MPGIFDTPKKAQIKGALELAEYLKKTYGIKYTQQQIADFFGCHPNTVSKIKKIEKDEDIRTKPTLFGETRGRKRKVTDEEEDCQDIVTSKAAKKGMEYGVKGKVKQLDQSKAG